MMKQKLDTLEQYREFVHSFDTFLIDMDGVLWHGNELLPGVRETLAFLHGLGKKLIFVTNNSTQSRTAYVEKFKRLGMGHVEMHQIFGSAYIAACYLESLAFDKSKQVYVIGETGLTDELANLGYTTCGGMIGAVLCGLDGNLNYLKLAKAHTYLTDPTVLFLATNMDPTFPTAGRTFPGAGSLFTPLVHSTGRTPRVLGKPDVNVYAAICAVHGDLDLARTCMVGDRLETDIAFGHRVGCRTLLVLTGVTTVRMLNDAREVVPDFYVQGFGELVQGAMTG